MQKEKRTMRISGFVFCALASACAGNEALGGDLSVLLEAEDSITEGIASGTEADNIQDGWAVSFDKYIVTIGTVRVRFSTDETLQAKAADVFVVDLTQVPAAGLLLWRLEGLREGRWEFFYATPGAAGATRHNSVSQKDYEAMVAGDLTYFVDGVLTKADGQSCPPAALSSPGGKAPNGNTSGGNACYDASAIRFTFGATAKTAFGPCEIDEVPGFAIAGKQTVAATIHGDHLYFNGFPEGDEGGTRRLAQWWADCDLNLDGTVTTGELKAIMPAQLPEIDERFQLGGATVAPLDDMYTYVIAQLKTQGHFQGEGECPLDGKAHE